MGHPYKSKELQLLVVDNEMPGEINDMSMDTVPSEEEMKEVMKLSLNTVVAISNLAP